MRSCFLFMCAFLWTLVQPCHGQQKFFVAWEHRVRVTASQQPGWAVPVFTPSSGLVQLIRFDAIRQYTSAHSTTWNIDASKGFNFIPCYKTEVDINLPPFLKHNSPGEIDGPGDFSLLLKYRILGANEGHGNYAVSGAIAGTAPTGSYKNGASDGTISPTVFAGKGFRSFDLQTAASVALPTGHSSTLGRPITWNTAFQQRIRKIFWPEVEVNTNFLRGGPHDGKIQTFVSPGFEVSKIALTSDERNRLAVVFGVGEQIATTHYHAYNHALSFTTRLVF